LPHKEIREIFQKRTVLWIVLRRGFYGWAGGLRVVKKRVHWPEGEEVPGGEEPSQR